MRLWHKDLIPYLPRKQLLAQWRELYCIVRNVYFEGTPNHILVNKALSSSKDFYNYSVLVRNEMTKRGYKLSNKSVRAFDCRFTMCEYMFEDCEPHKIIYKNWHNDRYLKQCLYNLQEKYDCGGIPENEWQVIANRFESII